MKDNQTIINFPGTPEDKLKLFFDMYDVTGEGKLDREAFKKMMKLVVEEHFNYYHQD